jgi:hypothetical protein
MNTLYEFTCWQCAVQHLTETGSLPDDWVGTPCGASLCPDCARVDGLSKAARVATAFTPDDAKIEPEIGCGVERFFATAMPNANAVLLSFSHGSIHLSLAESEALAACLTGANQIARGEHSVQVRLEGSGQ